jgi:hypothetical protein
MDDAKDWHGFYKYGNAIESALYRQFWLGVFTGAVIGSTLTLLFVL